MSVRCHLVLTVSCLMLSLSGRATTYLGNARTGFCGPIGLGSLTLTDDGTTISGTLTKGPNGFNDVLVIYIDNFSGGFTATSGFNDAADGLRRAISGIDGGANRSLLTFGTGFTPSYAIALGPDGFNNFGGLWGLANGNNNSLNFVSSVNLNPTGTAGSATYTFSFGLSQIGLTPGAGQSFRMMGTYISDSGFRSDEALPGDDTGTQGWNPFLVTQTADYTTTAVPEPSTL